ncbi:MAG: DUF11 domain-containing protein, partial [bacterium]|nr:DUF11 domain-containing protein [bacterium]
LDATASPCAGPAMTTDTPFRVFFATANSLNNPLQKDVVLEGEFTPGGDPIPFGDTLCVTCGTLQQPIVQAATSSGCGPATLSANVVDSLQLGAGGTAEETIASVDFYYWDDANGNGLADDGGSSWLWAAAAASVGFGTWEANWDSTSLGLGQYLIGVRAQDDQGNITWSHLTPAEAAVLGTPPNYANPTDPGVSWGGFINECGTSPSATKSASVSEVVAGGTVDFTITVNASLIAALSVSAINDTLPPGWTYASDQGGTLVPTTSPIAGASGTITWTFAPAAVIAAGGNGTLIFRATAPALVGTYTNVAEAVTGEGNFATNPAEVGVGAPQLTIAKSVEVAAANPGDTVNYTITYSNDSPVGVTNAVITDILPTGLTFVSATDGGSYDGPSRTITWNVGDLPSGSGTSTVTFTVTVDNPYPP